MSLWVPVKDGDDRARALYRRHYSAYRYRDGRRPRQFVGPGQHMVLLTLPCDALFVWRLFIENGRTEPRGVNCAVFRNESPGHLSSELILDAERWAWDRWPDWSLYTFVNPQRIRSTNPGYCFQMAGWMKTGVTKGGLVILEKQPDRRHAT